METAKIFGEKSANFQTVGDGRRKRACLQNICRLFGASERFICRPGCFKNVLKPGR